MGRGAHTGWGNRERECLSALSNKGNSVGLAPALDATEVSGVDGVVIRAPMSLVLPEASVHASARPHGARHHLARLDLRTRGLCVSAQQSPIARR